nr:hypothetical protein Itr_chr15CG07940 [Ipomoea trifida]
MRASEPRPAPDPMKRRRLRTQSIDEGEGIFRVPDGSCPSPSLEPLYQSLLQSPSSVAFLDLNFGARF